jgi:UDP-N-acetylmuramoyl-L-alanyl-D-glutamate--2,6-diaminopimelate ligase
MVETPPVARYNVSNCLAAITVGYLRGVALEIMARALATFPGLPERMERIEAGQPYMVVDYAHTADTLEKALGVLRPLTAGRLIVVFGSAGERDRVKRPEMGKAAARPADFAVIIDEVPREEDTILSCARSRRAMWSCSLGRDTSRASSSARRGALGRSYRRT